MISKDFLNERFYYVDGNLFYKHNIGRRIKKDDMAGCLDTWSMYKKCTIYKKSYSIHRLIWIFFNGNTDSCIDHIDRNRLNNKIENLRIATKSENQRNKVKTVKNCHSKYIGVYKNCRNTFYASIRDNKGQTVHVGTFETEEIAALARNRAAVKYHGEFASLNIIVR